MSTISEAREAIATAVTAAGLQTFPYPPDNPQPPVAFLDVVTSDWISSEVWFCAPVLASYTLIALAERNDVASSLKRLEDLIGPVAEALENIGVRTTAVSSGGVEIGGITLPAVTWQLQARTT